MHLLPIYPSSGDGGFAPLTYQDVDPKFGTWEDVKALADTYDVQMECMVNHISPASKEFQDYLAKGSESEFADMFVDWNKLWGGMLQTVLLLTGCMSHIAFDSLLNNSCTFTIHVHQPSQLPCFYVSRKASDSTKTSCAHQLGNMCQLLPASAAASKHPAGVLLSATSMHSSK